MSIQTTRDPLLITLTAVQIATEVAQENAASQRYATASLGFTLFQSQPRSLSDAGRHSATDQIIAGLAAENYTVANMLRTVAYAKCATSIAQLRQSVQHTEMHTAALERQVMQAQSGPVALHEWALPSRRRQLRTQKYVESITGSMACMIAQKKTRVQKGHSQRLQACWPLDLAPGPEQQIAAFAQVSKGMAPLQSDSAVGAEGRPAVCKLQLQSLLSPINEATASAEVQYWQKVAITVPDKQSVMALLDTVSEQANSQQAAVTALKASPSAAYLACGGSSGKLVVLHVSRGVCWLADASGPRHVVTADTAIAGN